MADNKYITHNQENGAVMISEDVIATIVSNAVKDVEGVVSIETAKTGLERVLLNKGMKIDISNDNEIIIDCDITVTYGTAVVTVAKAAQDAACSAVEAMTGIKPTAVNIDVVGIVRQ